MTDVHHFRRRWRPVWLLLGLATLLAACVLAPLASLAWEASQGSAGLWQHLGRNVLPAAASNTIVLLAGVGLLTTVLGAGCAWLVSAYRFPGQAILSWALLLPLAVPTYIVAYAYLDLLHPLGPIQETLRNLLGYDSPRQFRLPDIRSLGGAILLLGFVLYPYVYLTARMMFQTQAAGLLEAARTLGATRRDAFFRVALPLARPAVAVGVSLALLETLNDIGASEFLGVQTLTVAVYNTWVSRSDLAGAAQIALSMLLLVVLLIWLERHARRRQRYATTQRPRPMQPTRVAGWRGWLLCAIASLPVLLGFVLPAAYLLQQTLRYFDRHGALSQQLTASAINTISVAAVATLLTLAAGLLLAAARRLAPGRHDERLGLLALRIGSLGYAVPGTIVAIGLLAPMAWVDQGINGITAFWGDTPQLWLMGSTAALVLAYLIRFLAIAAGGIEAGYARIPPALDRAARSLGEDETGVLRRVHLPLLRPALFSAALLVFVDTMKELPATLLLRPLNFETLATWLYAEAARGTYEEGAVAALAIVAAGLLPVILLARAGSRPVIAP
ncbi:iron ABC transporter permease [Kerstersia gyiorum]|uniref:ABC transporter permease n=1 Tax=Kerstersia gyiorum TaxID=206506 RepID=UPI0030D5B213